MSCGGVRHQLRDLLQMESQVRRARGVGCEAAEGTGAREQPPQADVCRSLPGECGAQGCHRKKALRPAERREVVTHLVTGVAFRFSGPVQRWEWVGPRTIGRSWTGRDGAPVIAALTTLWRRRVAGASGSVAIGFDSMGIRGIPSGSGGYIANSG